MASILLSCSSSGPDNSPPQIADIAANPEIVLPGESLELAATVTDPDGDPLTFSWSTYKKVGNFSNDAAAMTSFDMSDIVKSGMSIKFTLTVSDGKSTSARDKWIRIDTGNTVTGYVFFARTRIPVPGTIVTLGVRADTSDIDGGYTLTNVSGGDYELLAIRNGFDEYRMPFNLGGDSIWNIGLTSSVSTGSLSGMVKTIDEYPLEKVRVTLLNQDGTPTELSDTSDALGSFHLDQLPLGTRLLKLENVGNQSFDILSEELEVPLLSVDNNRDLIGKVRRVVFESDGLESPWLWDFTSDGLYDAWYQDTMNNCYRYDFCQIGDFGQILTLLPIEIPLDISRLYWTVDIDLTEAATEVDYYIDGNSVYWGTLGGGTRRVKIDEPVDLVPAYISGHSFSLGLVTWPERVGVCGSTRLYYLSLYYYR